jgi:putative flippase GtrA
MCAHGLPAAARNRLRTRMSAIPRQLIRYAIVGVASNAVLYLAYLGLTFYGTPPKAAMSIGYAIGVVHGFAVNRRWTFGQCGAGTAAFARYLTAYAIGYIANFAMLVALVDGAGLPHQLVQGIAVLTIAALLFMLQKLWVFPTPGPVYRASRAGGPDYAQR